MFNLKEFILSNSNNGTSLITVDETWESDKEAHRNLSKLLIDVDNPIILNIDHTKFWVNKCVFYEYSKHSVYVITPLSTVSTYHL